jgi:hypothetical protein
LSLSFGETLEESKLGVLYKAHYMRNRSLTKRTSAERFISPTILTMPDSTHHVYALCILILSHLFIHISSAQFNPNCTRDTYFPPRCTGDVDPLTGKTCGNYGYDCTWTVTEMRSIPERRILVNGMWPPPAIQVAKGDRIRIALVNQLGEDVTLHFHGLLMENGYTIMDGPQHLIQA